VQEENHQEVFLILAWHPAYIIDRSTMSGRGGPGSNGTRDRANYTNMFPHTPTHHMYVPKCSHTQHTPLRALEQTAPLPSERRHRRAPRGGSRLGRAFGRSAASPSCPRSHKAVGRRSRAGLRVLCGEGRGEGEGVRGRVGIQVGRARPGRGQEASTSSQERSDRRLSNLGLARWHLGSERILGALLCWNEVRGLPLFVWHGHAIHTITGQVKVIFVLLLHNTPGFWVAVRACLHACA